MLDFGLPHRKFCDSRHVYGFHPPHNDRSYKLETKDRVALRHPPLTVSTAMSHPTVRKRDIAPRPRYMVSWERFKRTRIHLLTEMVAEMACYSFTNTTDDLTVRSLVPFFTFTQVGRVSSFNEYVR